MTAPKGRLGPVQKAVVEALQQGGFVRVKTGVATSLRVSPLGRGSGSLTAVERFTLHNAAGTLIKKLTRHQVEGCCHKGILDFDAKQLPRGGLLQPATNLTLRGPA